MPGEFYFMAIGGLGVSLAGFAGLIAALDRRPDARSVISAWRIRNIVIGGFMLTVSGFGVIAIHAVTQGNVTLTVRISSLLLAVMNLLRMRAKNRPGPAWPSRLGWWWAIGSMSFLVAWYLVNVFAARVGLLMLLLVFQLLDPLSIFFNTVRDVARVGTKQEDRST